MDSLAIETAVAPVTQVPAGSETQITAQTPPANSTQPGSKISKDGIRTSLKASTADGLFATVFTITTSGILLGNFLVELDASPVVFGMLSSIPMIVNMIQPLGAYLSERTTSRRQYSVWMYLPSRVLWLILFLGIAAFSWGILNPHQLVVLTLLVVLISNLLGALGSASWLSWLAILVPRRLRGRYFGFRNSVISLTNLICVPLTGVVVSNWYGGTIQGYGVVLLVGVVAGFVSMVCQRIQVDVNPQLQNASHVKSSEEKESEDANNLSNQDASGADSIWKNSNFLMFLLYLSAWMFAVNLSLPFFNLYMLDTLNLDVSLVAFYGSFQAGANLLLMIVWGRLADKIGNRPILLVIGVVASSVPLLWLGIGTNLIDLWLWLPLIHIFIGGNWAALDLCNNNLQIEVASVKNQSIYFAIAAAFAGFSGALGTTIGGFVAENPHFGGLQGLFVVSGGLRVAAIIPLLFIKEPRAKSFTEMIQPYWQFGKREEVRS